MKPRANRPPQSDELSDQELSQFLIKLAGLYASEATGNLRLAAALQRLATKLDPARGRAFETSKTGKKAIEPTYALAGLSEARRIASAEISSRETLIHLANTRFGIPPSRLRRMKIDEVRRLVQAAIEHEASLDAIAKVASSAGASRTS